MDGWMDYSVRIRVEEIAFDTLVCDIGVASRTLVSCPGKHRADLDSLLRTSEISRYLYKLDRRSRAPHCRCQACFTQACGQRICKCSAHSLGNHQCL